jgi:hypothetical protein
MFLKIEASKLLLITCNDRIMPREMNGRNIIALHVLEIRRLTKLSTPFIKELRLIWKLLLSLKILLTGTG